MTADNPAARVDALTEAEREALWQASLTYWRQMPWWPKDATGNDDPEFEEGERDVFLGGEGRNIAATVERILADRLAPLLAERDDALTRADMWREEFDKAAALTTRWRVRAEAAEAERAEARAEGDGLRERMEAVEAHLAARSDHIVRLSNETPTRTDAYRLAGKAEGLRIGTNLLRAALADPEAS
jgi:hypothetical protein